MKTEEFQYEMSFGTTADIIELVELAALFWNQSALHEDGKIDLAQYRATLRDYMRSDHVRVAVAKVAGKIVGYFMFYATREYKDSLDGELYQFFVHPDYRGSGIARDLVGMAVKQFDEWGCVVSFASASPEIGNIELKHFRNLFAKFGYVETGIIMKRKLNHGR